ncbi:hypothetical protein Trydic_g5003 [Trypoxylus dichotomus]
MDAVVLLPPLLRIARWLTERVPVSCPARPAAAEMCHGVRWRGVPTGYTSASCMQPGGGGAREDGEYAREQFKARQSEGVNQTGYGLRGRRPLKVKRRARVARCCSGSFNQTSEHLA